ncbi:MAG: HDOD domain-containing protein [Thermodesulfobacteriota bacterium]
MKTETKTPRQFVASGNWVISNKKSLILQAYLGSCVGVALYDSESEVGGLAHFLLPEPTSLNKELRAGTYAKTGLPIFLKHLYDAGARKNRLKAAVAGGALVGPVSRDDLEFDIGNRTTETVQAILRDHGIPIVKVETGGYFGCQLSLNLTTFTGSIQPIINHGSPATKKISEAGVQQNIAQIISSVRPIPQIALKVARMIHDKDYGMREISKEIKQDQIISAKIIRLCNSAFLGLKTRVDSIDRALVLLGEKMLLQLVVSASLEEYFSESINGYSLCKGGLYQHTLKTAIVAEELAKYTRKVPSDIAYTAGLLHDIGKVVLDQYIFPIYPFFYRQTETDMNDICEVEEKKLGITHPDAGALLAKNWSLPKNLTDVIKFHHYPENALIDVELTHLVYVADLLMSKFQVGQELEFINTDNLSMRLQTLGLTASQFPVLIDLIPQKLFDASFLALRD